MSCPGWRTGCWCRSPGGSPWRCRRRCGRSPAGGPRCAATRSVVGFSKATRPRGSVGSVWTRACRCVLVTGGGTGALGLNTIVAAAAPLLIEHGQVLHLTGRGRGVETADLGPRYQQREFLVEEMPDVAGRRVGRGDTGGHGHAERARRRSAKPTLIVPMPGSHQEANARAFSRGGGALVFDQADLSPALLAAHGARSAGGFRAT